MNFEHNTERDIYLNTQGKVALNACPGSGKTTSVAYKLTRLTKNWHQTHSKFVGIACLSFTNVAKDQIAEKYSLFSNSHISFPHIVSTIDSFINQYITLPFYYLFTQGSKDRPRILDDARFLDDLRFRHSISRLNNRGQKYQAPLKYMYRPSTIDTNMDGTYSSNARRPNLSGDELHTFNSYCRAVKHFQYSNGLLKTTDSTLVALQLLQDYPVIASMLALRFPYIIIDEAQDTSEIQYAILDNLIQNGLRNVELIGDPYQSLFEFREARPDLFWERYDSTDWQSLQLNDCRRSTQNIVDCYSLLRKQSDCSIRSTRLQKEQEPVILLLYENPDVLLEKYTEISSCYDSHYVLVRGETHLQLLRAKTSHQSMWKIKSGLPHHLILGSFQRETGNVREAIDRIRRCLPGIIEPHSGTKRQLELFDEIKSESIWNVRIMRLLTMLPSMDTTVHDWTVQMQSATRSCFMLDEEPDFELKQGPMRPKHNLPVRDLYMDAPNSSFVTTIHKAKGRTFDSIMLVLSKNNQGQNLCLRNIERPAGIPDEKQRLIYVAMSRPRYQLVLAIPKEAGYSYEVLEETFDTGIVVHEL